MTEEQDIKSEENNPDEEKDQIENQLETARSLSNNQSDVNDEHKAVLFSSKTFSLK